jgi:hypothetical protein
LDFKKQHDKVVANDKSEEENDEDTLFTLKTDISTDKDAVVSYLKSIIKKVD